MNLWPQSYQTQPWNAHVKDALENELHRLVCSGQLDLKTAQHDISTDWIAAYKKYFHTDQPLSAHQHRHRARATSAPASTSPGVAGAPGSNATGQVWVNTRSGKYFRPGSRYSGKTKEGRYMTEAEARKQGYTAARE